MSNKISHDFSSQLILHSKILKNYLGTPPPFFTSPSYGYSESNQQGAPPPGIGFNAHFLPPNTPQEILSPPIFPQIGHFESGGTGIYPTMPTMPTPTLTPTATEPSSNFLTQEIDSYKQEPFVPISSNTSSSSNSERTSPVKSMQFFGVKGFGN